MKGEKDLLYKLVNFSVMEYFPHCFNFKCFANSVLKNQAEDLRHVSLIDLALGN